MSKFYIKKHTIQISHTDTDGYTCSLLLNSKVQKSINIDYGEMDFSKDSILRAWISQHRYLVITDLSLSQKNIDQLGEIETLQSIIIVDHHKSSEGLKMPSSIFKMYYDGGKSASKALADLLGINNPYIAAVNAADIFLKVEVDNFRLGRAITDGMYSFRVLLEKLFEFKSKEFNKAMIRYLKLVSINPTEVMLYSEAPSMVLAALVGGITGDSSVVRYRHENLTILSALLAEDKAKVYYSDYMGCDILVLQDVNISISDVADYLLSRKGNKYEMVIMYNSRRNTISCRSTADKDSNAFMDKLCGGGGHHQAAGGIIKDKKEIATIESVGFYDFLKARM